MAYATTTDLNARLGDDLYARLTDRDAGQTASTTVAQEILDQAESLANGHLARRFQTPLDLGEHPELTEVLRTRVLDIAEYLAWRGTPFVSDLPGRILLLYEDAVQWFDRIGDGRAELPAASPPSSSSASDPGPAYTSSSRPFTHDELDGL